MLLEAYLRKHWAKQRFLNRIIIFETNNMKPSTALSLKRAAVRKLVLRYKAVNPRVFGSILQRTDSEGSDLDLLVDTLPGATLFDLGSLQIELEALLGVQVDLLTPTDIPEKFREQVLAEARPV